VAACGICGRAADGLAGSWMGSPDFCFVFIGSIYLGWHQPTASDNAQINGDLLIEAVAFARLRKYKMSASEKNSVVVTAPSVDIICKGARTILLKIKASLKPE